MNQSTARSLSPFVAEGCCSAEGCTSQKLPEPTPDAFLAVRGLSVSYGGRPAIEAVDLDVREGRVTALIGPSGCGKTSFLNALNRMTDLIPGCTVGGRVRFQGTDVLDGSTDIGWLRRNVGMVFQKANLFPLSIRANLHLPLREQGTPRRDLAGKTEEVLREVGLWSEVSDRLDAPALSLSGGQQQRLSIARALTLRPRLLLMDEPCSALDPLATETIERLVEGMRGHYSIVIVTHNLAQAQRVADDVAVFWCHDDSGCVIESGPAERVFNAPQAPDTVAYLAGRRG